MKYVCTRDCFREGRLFKVGQTATFTGNANIKHFDKVPSQNPSKGKPPAKGAAGGESGDEGKGK